MSELAGWFKTATEAGPTGVMLIALWLFYRLADKYGAAFLEAQKGQASAMTQQASAIVGLAADVKQSQANGVEVLMAVRLLADRLDQQRQYLVAIDTELRGRRDAA